ncbi:MAG: hypothetical protein NTV98_03870 [Candidatus Roizmanbacteria bacterium]|nr:hypothetical protein [Candidatus Roizmanbacteria bacterium]
MELFLFDSYSIDATKTVLTFVYKAGSERYEEKLYLPKPLSDSVDPDLLNILLFNLHIALGVSYWKMNCYPRIEIKSETLSKTQAQFWDLVYTKGLGEFYYRNKIDFRNLVSFPYSDAVLPSSKSLPFLKRELVGIGGGKDSIVSWERLKKEQISTVGLIIETQKKYEMMNELLTVGEITAIRIRREMDAKLITHKNNGAYHNGHVPISMIYAWIGIFAAVFYDYRAFVVSNEKSADEGNTELYGVTINHQWSKSSEFEKAFSEYIHTTISPDISYYSPLRDLTELEIVKEFITYPQYRAVVSSCNRNFSVTNSLNGKRWCGKCPKCAFAFLLFAAYLSKKEVIEMFGTNMLEDETLVNHFRDLLGRGTMKPFECVGTFEESQEALQMIKKKGEFNLSLYL